MKCAYGLASSCEGLSHKLLCSTCLPASHAHTAHGSLRHSSESAYLSAAHPPPSQRPPSLVCRLLSKNQSTAFDPRPCWCLNREYVRATAMREPPADSPEPPLRRKLAQATHSRARAVMGVCTHRALRVAFSVPRCLLKAESPRMLRRLVGRHRPGAPWTAFVAYRRGWERGLSRARAASEIERASHR